MAYHFREICDINFVGNKNINFQTQQLQFDQFHSTIIYVKHIKDNRLAFVQKSCLTNFFGLFPIFAQF